MIKQYTKKIIPLKYRKIIRGIIEKFKVEIWPRRIIRLLFNRKIILLYPKTPCDRYALFKICYLLGYRITNNPNENFHLVLNWEDNTYRTSDEKLVGLSKKYEVINVRCKDISKKHVDNVFKEVFGYSVMIDPFTYKGSCVKKSNINGLHDGKVIECPISKIEEDVVYQKVINSQESNDTVRCFRTPVFKTKIPFVYVKHRPLDDRFGIHPTKVELNKPNGVFSIEEINKIIRFCNLLGLEYGELDILRDNGDKKLYIVDANNTPMFSCSALTGVQQRKTLKLLATTFEEVFIKKR